MAVTEKRLKEYLRLPPDSDEDLRLYIDAAKSKARAAGIPDYRRNAQYDLFILALAAMHYDARGMAAPDGDGAQRLINGFVLELRHAGEDARRAGHGKKRKRR